MTAREPAPTTSQSTAAVPSAEGATPMMAQYIEIKAANPDCLLFYRMGDFYELFFDDAATAASVLGIALTQRGKHQGADIPMCGVPVHAATDYLHKLIAAGHRVAVCEQMEDPAEAKKRGSKSVVKRAVTRLVTAGTITEETLLDARAANLCVALALQPDDAAPRAGIAALELSTGAFTVLEAAQDDVAAELSRLEPSEVLIAEGEEEAFEAALAANRAARTLLPRSQFDGREAEARLTRLYGIDTLESFGAFSRVELRAASALAAYVETTQVGKRPPLLPLKREGPAETMRIDAASRANLELTRALSGGRAGSLLAAIDRTVTGAGARLLARRITGPSLDLEAITARLDAVSFLLDEPDLRAALIRQLKSVGDLERALTRLALERGGPRDLASVRDTLFAARAIAGLLGGTGLPAALEAARCALTAPDPAIEAALAHHLVDAPPILGRDGGFIRDGALAELDEARSLRDDTRKVIAALQARYESIHDLMNKQTAIRRSIDAAIVDVELLAARSVELGASAERWQLDATAEQLRIDLDALELARRELADL